MAPPDYVPRPIYALDVPIPLDDDRAAQDPPGPRRPGVPRADTPRPRSHSIAESPPRPRAPTPDSATGTKRDLALRSPAAASGTALRKRARTSPAQTSRQTSPEDPFDAPRRPEQSATPAHRAPKHPPRAPAHPVSPANVPLPPSDELDGDSDFESMYAPTEDDAGDPRDVALDDMRSGARTADLVERRDGGTTAVALAPGSVAEQVASTDDVLPSARDTFVYTPIPPEGSPVVNPTSPRWLFQNLDVPQIVLWENIPGGKLFATIFGGGGADHLIDSTLFAKVASIRTELIRFTGIQTIKVTPPDPASRPTSLNAPPYGFLVHGLREDDAARLLAMGFLSTPKVTVLFFPFAVTYPTLMVNFMFISDKTNDEVRRMVVALLRRPDNRARILDLVALSPSAGEQHRDNARARDIIKSAAITSTPRSGRGGTPTPVFNLYVDTRASSIDEWKRWKAFFTTLHWHDAEFGTLGLHDDVFCPGCRGADHYRWACPFMVLHEWKGTMPKQPWKGGAPDTRPNATRTTATAGKRKGGRDTRA